MPRLKHAKMPAIAGNKSKASSSAAEQGLLRDHRNRRQEHSSSDEDEDDLGLLSAKTPRQRSLARAGALTLLCLTAVVMMISVMTLRKGNMFVFNGRMKLVSVSVVFNHGAQASDLRQTWETSKWAEGNGELTVVGMQQMYAFGRTLREKYVDTLRFLPTRASRIASKAVWVRSTAKDRNVDSATALLLGLFDKSSEALPKDLPEKCPCRPRRGGVLSDGSSSAMCIGECIGIFDGSVHRHVPPVEVEPLDKDWLLRQHLVCKGWQPGRDDTDLWTKTEGVFHEATEKAAAFLGAPELCEFQNEDSEGETDRICSSGLGLRELESLYENLLASETAGKPCPPDVKPSCRDTLASLHPVREFLYNYDFGTGGMESDGREQVDNAALAGGMLLGDILENMKRARKWHMPVELQPRDESSRPPSMYMYSADGANLAALLGTLKTPWHHAPRYGSYVTLELWAPRSATEPGNEELWMVNVLYDGQPLKTLPGCKGGYCRFKDFFYALFWTQARYEEDCLTNQNTRFAADAELRA